jgi:hypothetical protein
MNSVLAWIWAALAPRRRARQQWGDSQFFFFSVIFDRIRLDIYVCLVLILVFFLCHCVDLGWCRSVCEKGYKSLLLRSLTR